MSKEEEIMSSIIVKVPRLSLNKHLYNKEEIEKMVKNATKLRDKEGNAIGRVVSYSENSDGFEVQIDCFLDEDTLKNILYPPPTTAEFKKGESNG